MRLALATLLTALVLAAAPAAAATGTRDPEEYFFDLNMGDLKAELADAKSAGKKALFVMFEQDGCPGCLYMKKNVLNRVDVQNLYHKLFVNFSINIFGSIPITDFSGSHYTEKGYAQAIRIKGTPTFLFYDMNGDEVVRIVGPVKSASDFMLLGEFVASGAYKTRRFADYLQAQRKPKGS